MVICGGLVSGCGFWFWLRGVIGLVVTVVGIGVLIVGSCLFCWSGWAIWLLGCWLFRFG